MSLLLGSLSTFEYIKVSYEKCFHEYPGWHLAHMTNRAPAPLQYRVLSYLIPELLSRAGVPIGIGYIAERGAFLVAAGYAFSLFCRRWLGTVETLFCATLLMFFYTLSAFPHIQPSEEINLFAFALGLTFIRDRRFGPLVLTIVIGAMNKETVGFLIPLYAICEHRQHAEGRAPPGGHLPPWARPRISALLCARVALLASGLAFVYLGIRALFGTHRPYLAGLWQWKYNFGLIAADPFIGLLFLLPSLGPALWIFRHRRRCDPFFVAFLPSLCLFVVAHFAISRVDEFRTYTPLALMTIPASMLLLGDSLRSSRAGA